MLRDLAPDERKLDERFAPLRSAKSAALFTRYRQFNFACAGETTTMIDNLPLIVSIHEG